MPVHFSKENRVHLVVSRFKASVLYGDSRLGRQLFVCTVVEY